MNKKSRGLNELNELISATEAVAVKLTIFILTVAELVEVVRSALGM
jgi:hypothetical protein